MKGGKDSKEGKQKSLRVFLKYVSGSANDANPLQSSSNGSSLNDNSRPACNVSRMFSRECYLDWLSTRMAPPKNPEESFRKALSSHCGGMDGRKPFPEHIEAELLKQMRLRKVWECFEGSECKIGLRGYQVKGYWERIRETDAAATADNASDGSAQSTKPRSARLKKSKRPSKRKLFADDLTPKKDSTSPKRPKITAERVQFNVVNNSGTSSQGNFGPNGKKRQLLKNNSSSGSSVSVPAIMHKSPGLSYMPEYSYDNSSFLEPVDSIEGKRHNTSLRSLQMPVPKEPQTVKVEDIFSQQEISILADLTQNIEFGNNQQAPDIQNLDVSRPWPDVYDNPFDSINIHQDIQHRGGGHQLPYTYYLPARNETKHIERDQDEEELLIDLANGTNDHHSNNEDNF